jgi:hypothetical protein
MQDPRIRIAAASILSIASFISLQGAVAALLWWLVFTPRFRIIKKIRLVLSLILMIAFFSVVLELVGGNGISYFFRMTVIILVGMWVFGEHQSGEFLSTSVWLFGTRIGFDLGLVAEMGIQSLSSVTVDLDRIRVAEKIKGKQWGVRNLVPAALVLVHGALGRAEDTAELLAIRGYRSGGSLCPEFITGTTDRVTGLCALVVLLFALIPVSEFFILYR